MAQPNFIADDGSIKQNKSELSKNIEESEDQSVAVNQHTINPEAEIDLATTIAAFAIREKTHFTHDIVDHNAGSARKNSFLADVLGALLRKEKEKEAGI